ncbi:MAG: two pore domain potassium channel family protein [Spirulina sp. SIO3F2]|nr:two pore domain potassium channel family protein [Spirulina sp. SIO3F2]
MIPEPLDAPRSELTPSPDVIEAIAAAVVHKLHNPVSLDAIEPKVLSYPRYQRISIARQWLSLAALSLLGYALWNCFVPLLPQPLVLGRFLVALLVIGLGFALIIVLVSELFQGAGIDQEIQYRQGGQVIKDYQFIPSLNHFRLVLGLLVLGFITIILGFANLYTELVRQDPSNFGGLEPGFLAIYFSLVTFSTVGYGDIYPVSIAARLAAVWEIFTAMFFSLVVISSTLSWTIAHKRQQQQSAIAQRIQAAQTAERLAALALVSQGGIDVSENGEENKAG